MFWIGMLAAGAIAVFIFWVIKKGIKFSWYEWLLGTLAILFSMLAVQHYIGSLNEYEPNAGWMGLLIFGFIAVILYAVTAQLVWRHNRSSG